MKTLLLFAMSVLLLTGCATGGLSDQELALVQAQMASQTLKINCPSGCQVEYKDPRDAVQIPRDTNGWDALIAVGQSTERLVAGAIPVAGMGYLGIEAIKGMKGHGTVTNTDNSRYVGDYSGDGSGATTTDASTYVGDYSGGGSGNSGVIQPGNSGRIGSSDDYTADPSYPPAAPVPAAPAPVPVEL